MKKQSDKQSKRVIPAFASEAEEAKWWFKNRGIHGGQLLEDVKSGEAKVLTRDSLLKRLSASKSRLDSSQEAS